MNKITGVKPSKKRRSKTKTLNVLIVEDVEDDALLLVRHLEKHGFKVRFERVETADSLDAALKKRSWDVVLCDHGMIGFNATGALRIVKEHDLDPPFIVVSGTIGEEKAAEVMRNGAHDLILKNDLSRLVPAIERELREAMLRRSKAKADKALDLEQRLLQNLMASLPVAIYFKDLNHRYIRLNEVEARVLNAESVDSVIGKLADDFVPPDRAQLRHEEEERILSTGEALVDRIEEAPQADGTVRWLSATKAPILDRDGKIIGLVGITRDITTRKRAESDLLKRTEQLQVVLESMDQCLYAVDANLNCTMMNRHLADLYDLPPELARPGVSFADLARFNARKGRYGPGDIEEQVKQRVEVARENRPMQYEFDLRNGRIVELRSSPLPDGGFVRTATDITELKKKENALRDSEERFRAILEGLPSGVTLRDRSGHFLLANKTFCSWMASDADAVVGKSLFDLYPEDEAGEIHHRDLEVFATGRITVYESKRTYGDGKSRHVIVHRCPIRSAAGDIAAVSTISTDITDRKQADDQIRKLSSVVEQSPASVLVTDTDGVIEYVNQGFTEMTGYAPEEAIGKTSAFLRTEKTTRELADEMWSTIRAGKPWRGTFHNRKKDGSEFLAGTTIFPIEDNDGRITHFVATQQDITQRIADQNLLKQAEKMESLGNLAGGIAHDFNNMLLPIIALTDMTLKKLPAENEHRPRLEKVVQAGTRAKDLVSKILAFSRQEELKRAPTDVADIVDETLGLLRTTLPSTVAIEAKRNVAGIKVFADAGQIGTALMNLATNAADAMDGRPGTLHISLTRAEIGAEDAKTLKNAEPGAYARIRIRDTGHGMDAGTMRRIFEPFFTTKEVGKGTGLGLATVYGIVTSHGGFIDVASKIGKGTTFDVYLPLMEAQDGDRPAAHAEDLLASQV